ncbi:MAG: FtsX-like permease family protein [archaeon]
MTSLVIAAGTAALILALSSATIVLVLTLATGIQLGVFSAMMLTLILELMNKKHEVAILRVLGAKRRDILESVLLRSLLIGAIGLAAGIGIGVLIGVLMEAAAAVELIATAATLTLGVSLAGGTGAAKSFWNLKASEVLRD